MRPIQNNPRQIVFTTFAIVVLAFFEGCQGMGSKRVASAEPGLDSGTTLASSPPSTSVTWVDRHPLFAKPRDMFESTNSNKVVKTAAAAVVGVPLGFFGELKQIVVGRPSDPNKY